MLRRPVQWHNPVNHLTRMHGQETRLACQHCGACCSTKCEQYEIVGKKSACKAHELVESGKDYWTCSKSPKKLFSAMGPGHRGHKPNGEAFSTEELSPLQIGNVLDFKDRVDPVYSCKASQDFVDFVFGKGQFNLGKFYDPKAFIGPATHFWVKVQAILTAKTEVEYNTAKKSLAEYLNSKLNTKSK